MKKIFIFLISLAILSCGKNGLDDGATYTENFIRGYYHLEYVDKINAYDEMTIFSLNGDGISSNRNQEEFYYYARLYNDWDYKRKDAVMAYALIDTIQSVTILKTYKGTTEDISSSVRLECYSYYEHIKSNYTAHSQQIEVILTEINPDEMILLRPDYLVLNYDKGLLEENVEYEMIIRTTAGKEINKTFSLNIND
ncbi:MAG: hypothetical protein LIO79_10800 [Rikenellaceae bacterium]|nr:hypothetical protein [Rikenellaceae bacterium]